jgi:hypothetical protein
MTVTLTEQPWRGMDDFIARTQTEYDSLGDRAAVLRAELDETEATMNALADVLAELTGRRRTVVVPGTPKRSRPRTVSDERLVQIRDFVHRTFTPDDDITVAGLAPIASQTVARIALDHLRGIGEVRVVREGGPGRAATWRLMPDAEAGL